MKLIRIPGEKPRYPGRCACCLAPTSGTLDVRKEDLKRLALAALVATQSASSLRRSRATKVPYCPECRNHVRWARIGGLLGVVLAAIVYAFLGLFLSGIVWLFLTLSGTIEEQAKLPLFLIVGSGMAIGAASSLVHLRWRPAGPLGRGHVRPGDALEIAGFDDEVITVRCHNDRFADEVVRANPGAQPVARAG